MKRICLAALCALLALSGCRHGQGEEQTSPEGWVSIAPEELVMRPVDDFANRWMALSMGKGEDMNAMTIAWGSIGNLWGKPVVIVYVSKDRYSKALMDSADSFTLTRFPEERKYKDALVYLGSHSYVGHHAEIGDYTKIYENVYVGDNTKIGKHCIIYPGVSIYPGMIIGDNVIIHSNAVIGSDGFGNAPQPDGTWEKIEHLGNVIIGDNCEIGSCTTIDRAEMESTIIGKGVKIDNLCQIAHNVEIGDNTDRKSVV